MKCRCERALVQFGYRRRIEVIMHYDVALRCHSVEVIRAIVCPPPFTLACEPAG